MLRLRDEVLGIVRVARSRASRRPALGELVKIDDWLLDICLPGVPRTVARG
jgi:hypothetical protein